MQSVEKVREEIINGNTLLLRIILIRGTFKNRKQ